jgi:hypothetical protein
MKILYVHERFGALAGAEANVSIVASALAKRGLSVAILHGQGTGKNEDAWRSIFPHRFPISPSPRPLTSLSSQNQSAWQPSPPPSPIPASVPSKPTTPSSPPPPPRATERPLLSPPLPSQKTAALCLSRERRFL